MIIMTIMTADNNWLLIIFYISNSDGQLLQTIVMGKYCKQSQVLSDMTLEMQIFQQQLQKTIRSSNLHGDQLDLD